MGRRGGMCKRAFETVSPKNYTCPAPENGPHPDLGRQTLGGGRGAPPSGGGLPVVDAGESAFPVRFSASPPLLAARKGASVAKNRMAVAARPSSAPPPLLPPVTRMSGTNFAP